MAQAQGIDPGNTNSGPTYIPLNSWSFQNHTNWTSDTGYAPVSFTNLSYSDLGNGNSLVVDTNIPAWLQYNVFENDGTTNLTVDTGTVMFWFAPNWSGTNQGGSGPGVFGRLLEVGTYTTNSSYGFWSLYVDDVGNNLYFSAQTNDLSGTFTNYLTVPIAWTTNYFHFITLTYSATNTALYLDGTLATNRPGVSIYPGTNVLANGFYVGSSSNGVNQVHGMFNSLQTFNTPLDGGTIRQIFSDGYLNYMINPLNTAMFMMTSASSSPSFNGTNYAAITGAGNLQWVGSASTCVDGADQFHVWITNVTAVAASNGTMNVTFTIEGGLGGYPYDVFATAVFQPPLANCYCVWLGQGYHCNTYTVNIPSSMAFLILGTPQDTDGDGLTDAYEQLVSKTDPTQAQSDVYGVPIAWYLQNGLSPMSGTQDPDRDGLLNYQEYLFGTKPKVSEGFSIWTTPVTSNIP
jgi:hypothetical protein